MSSKRPRSGSGDTSVADAYRIVSMREPTQDQLAAFPPNLTPLDKQVFQLRQQVPASMILLVVCGYKVKFYGRDSRVASRRLGLVCVRTSPFETSSFPVVRLAHYLVRLTDMGYVVAFADQVETAAIRATGAKSSTKVFERKVTAIYSRATTSSATFEALQQNSTAKASAAAGGGADDDGGEDGDPADGGDGPAPNIEMTAGHRHQQEASLRFVLFLVHSKTSSDAASDVWSLQVVSFLSLVRSEPETVVLDIERRVEEILLKCDPCAIVCNSGSLPLVEALLERIGVQDHYHTGPSDTGQEDAACRSLVGTMFDATPSCTLKTLVAEFTQRLQVEGALPLLRGMPIAEVMAGHGHRCLHLPVTACNALHLFDQQRHGGSPQHKGGGMGSLLQHLDRCWTKAGSRMLRSWLSAPLCDAASIHDRQCVLRMLAADSALRAGIEAIMTALKGYLSDPEATLSRMLIGHASVLEVVALVRVVTRLHNAATSMPVGTDHASTADAMGASRQPSLVAQLVRAVCDGDAFEAVRALMGKMNLNARVPAEVFEEVASLPQPIADVKAAMADAATTLQAELASVRRVVGMPQLEFATIAGVEYLIDLPQAKLSKSTAIPSDWVVVSRTKSNVRYHTSGILAASARLFAARDKLQIASEREWIALQLWFAQSHTAGVAGIRGVLRSAGTADALYALYTVSQQPGYCVPTICEGPAAAARVSIVKGRHPMLDVAMGGTYVAADVVMQPSGVWLLTGPNMGGKSALMRTVGLFAVMAQMGCSVPATQCSMPLFDALYVRMGSEDAILDNRSTFLTEMVETQEILCSPHLPRSLVLMDELGQGTSSFDGLAVASATLDFLVRSGATVIFVTHHSTLCDKYRHGDVSTGTTVECKYMSFIYDGDKTAVTPPEAHAPKRGNRSIRFLHVPVDGVTPSSFGIQVASMANLPPSVVDIARARSEAAESQQRRRVELHTLSTFCRNEVLQQH